MIVVPELLPVNTPVVLTVAMPVLLLLQTPPPGALLKTVVVLVQILAAPPVIGAGDGLTMIVVVYAVQEAVR
jgi:hypothetical protein